MSDPRLEATAAIVAAHLHATRALALDRTAERWIAEADAVATDLLTGSDDASVLTSRLRTVEQLLENVDSTGHSHADVHVAKARQMLGALRRDRSEP